VAVSQEWFCYINGQVRGPLDARAIRDMAERGQLKPTDQVRRGDDGQWAAANSIKGLTFWSLAVAPSQAPPTVVEPTLPPPASVVAAGLAPRFVYKMVQVPPVIKVAEGTSTKDKAAAYLEDIVNEYAGMGWEFYRVDSIGIRVMPGCLAGLLGVQPTERLYHVVCFRRPVGN